MFIRTKIRKKKKKKIWKQQQKTLQKKEQEENQKKLEELEKFEKRETSILPNSTVFSDTHSAKQSTENAVKKQIEANSKTLRSFWVPSLTPASKTLIAKPNSCTTCPESGKPLRLKQLIPISFTPLKNVDQKDMSKLGRWMCPICYKTLTNKVSCGALKTSRKILCFECIEKFVLQKKDENKMMKDPLNGKVVLKKDVIKLQSGGTGYAGKEGQKNLMVQKEDVAFIG